MRWIRPADRAAAVLRSLAIAAVALLAPAGCQDATTQSDALADQSLGEGEWAIILDQVAGQGHAGYARQIVRDLGTQTGLDGFWTVDEGAQSSIYFGKYDSLRDEQAQKDLKRLQLMQQQGRLQVGTVNLVPVRQPVVAGELKPWDLRGVREPGAVYTLQVGFYDRQFGENFRDAAEQAVAAYRNDGDEAYFYHGPNRSLVTIGVFGAGAAKVATEGPRRGAIVYDPFIVDLQKKHPYNLANGVTLRTRDPVTGRVTDQTSFLVRIPK